MDGLLLVLVFGLLVFGLFIAICLRHAPVIKDDEEDASNSLNTEKGNKKDEKA